MTTYDVTRDVYAVLNSVPLATPAWQCTNPLELLKPAQRRGQDRVIPGAAGVRVKKRRAAPTRRQLQLVIWGAHKWDGTEHPSADVGVQRNLDHLTDNLWSATGAAVTAVLYLPDSTSVTGSIHVESIDWEFHDYDATVTIDLTIPAGALA